MTNEGDELDGDLGTERERRRRDKRVRKRSEDIYVKTAEETKVKNGDPIMRRLHPVQGSGGLEEICDKLRNATKSGLTRDEERCMKQEFMTRNEEVITHKNLRIQNLRSRDTSRKRGKPPQLESLGQREMINVDIAGREGGMQELKRL